MSGYEPSDSSYSDTSIEDPTSCGKTGQVLIFYDDFRCGFHPEKKGSHYKYFSAPGLIAANDAAGGFHGECQCLTVNSSPFTYTVPNGMDHTKFLVYQKNDYRLPKTGELVYESIMAVQQTGLSSLPEVLQSAGGSLTGVNNANSDLRLASAALVAVDPKTGITYDFFFTNEDIYAFYEWLPINRTEFGGPGPNYEGFSHAIPVAKRDASNPLNDFTKVAIAFNYRQNIVRWIVNDIEVYRINRIGFPVERKYRILDYTTAGQPAGPSRLVRTKKLRFGFGTFSIMDAYNPQNPGQVPNAGLVDLTFPGEPIVDPILTDPFGNTLPPTYVTTNPLPGFPGTNFGQGAILRMKYVSIYIRADVEEIREFPGLYGCKTKCLLSREFQNCIPGVNASASVVETKCKGCLKDCDKCEDKCEDGCGCKSQKCDCPSCHKKNKKKHHRKHKCKCYQPCAKQKICEDKCGCKSRER